MPDAVHMVDAHRHTTAWRQGRALSHEAAMALGLTAPEGPERTVVVMVTHDCDITGALDREPDVEVIVGRRIEALGADTHAKTARRLHIAFQTDDGEVPVELMATNKVRRTKAEILASEPRLAWSLSPEALVTLQQWLAARYRRAAFADEFEDRLKARPSQLDRKIAKAMSAAGRHVLAVFFNVDDGEEWVRNGPDDVYLLRITLLYDSTKDEPTAYAAAARSVQAIEEAFEKSLFSGGRWRQIQLMSCDAVSDSVLTIADSRLLKRWRLDHMSLADEPQQAVFDNG